MSCPSQEGGEGREERGREAGIGEKGRGEGMKALTHQALQAPNHVILPFSFHKSKAIIIQRE